MRRSETERLNAETRSRGGVEEKTLSGPQHLGDFAFEETEIGLLPTEWEVKLLRDLVATRTSNRDPREEPDEVFRYIEISSISNESYRIEDWRVLKGSEAPSRARKIIKAGDTLFSTVRPYLRNIAQVPSNLDDEIGTTGFCVLRTESEQLDPDYLYFYTLTNNFVNRVVAHQSGSSYPAVSNRDVLSEAIPLPPLSEQQRIAGALRTIQEAIAAQEDVIAAARELKRSLMERVFTYGPDADLAPTKETEFGEVPEHWDIVELGDVIEEGPRNGIYKPKDLYGSGTMILRIDDYENEGTVVSRAENSVELSDSEVEKYSLNSGELLINRVNSLSHIGKAALVGNLAAPMVFESNMMRFRVNSDVVMPKYAFYFLTSPMSREQMRSKAKRAVAQSSINQGDVKSMMFPIPPVTEQGRIVHVLDTADGKVVAAEQRKVALEELFRSALEQLMTGRIRL